MKLRAALFLAAVAISGVLFIDLCGFVFSCGCRSLWAGAAEDCNIHEPEGPHCPWCEHPLAGGAVAFLGTLGAQSWIFWRRRSLRPAIRFALALAAFPLVSGGIGLLQALLWGYPLR